MAVLVVAATGVAACSGGDDSTPTATVAAPSTTTTTAATDPYAVPAVIDAAYVNRVLAGLDAAVGDVVRLVVRTRSIPQEAIDRLRSLYADDFLQIQVANFQDDLTRDFAGYAAVPGNKKSTITELTSTAPDCIFLRAVRDYGDVSEVADGANATQWIALERTTVHSEYNPTGWRFLYEGFEPGRTAPMNPCVAR